MKDEKKNPGPSNESLIGEIPDLECVEMPLGVQDGRIQELSQRVGQISVDYLRLLANVRTLAESIRRLAKGKSLGALGIPTEDELK